MAQFGSRFATFADEDDEHVQQKPQQQQAKKNIPKDKKVVVKVAKAQVDVHEGEEFQTYEDRRQGQASRGNRGGDRAGHQDGERGGRGRASRGSRGGDRGGRGGDRGGRGRGDREDRGDREFRVDRPDRGSRGGDRGGRGGDRGGRGRGDRNRGEEYRTKEFGTDEDGERHQRTHPHGDQTHYQSRFEGKPREEFHPMDRQSGTGRGKRDGHKQGYGKGNWGDDKKSIVQDAVEGMEEAKDEKADADKQERKERHHEPEPVKEESEEEETKMTLDDYLAQKQANSKGLLKESQAREHTKMQSKHIEANQHVKLHVNQIDTKLAGRDVYSTSKAEGAELLGFSAPVDDDFESRGARGGRGGGRGRGDRPDRGPRGPRNQRGGRKGSKLVIDDQDFPAL